nr:MAG TPA: hypothetical protein [Caudoviricetes sp.]
MAITIYNHALEDYFPVDLSEYGFKKNIKGYDVWASSQGETLSFLETGDIISITFKAAGSETKITLNDAEYTVADGEVTVSEIALIMPITVKTSENAAGGIVVYSCTKKSIPATTDDNFANMHLYFPFSPTGETLEAATADFTVYTDTPSKWDKGTVIDIHDADGILGRFYVDTCIKTYAGQYAVTASDVINRLSNISFLGYIGHETAWHTIGYTYTKVFSTVKTLCTDIFGNFDFTVTNACKNIEVPGYIPSGNARDALQYMCFGCGLSVRTYRTDKPVIQSADTYATHTIADTRVADGVSVSETDKKTAVSIMPLRYIANLSTTTFDMFEGMLPVGTVVLTVGYRTYRNDEKEPIAYKLSASDIKVRGQADGSKPATIIKTTGAATVLNVTGTEAQTPDDNGNYSINLYGHEIKPYYWSKNTPASAYLTSTYLEPLSEVYGNGEAMELSESATTITYHNAEAVANRMISHYSKSREATVSYIMSKNEMPGDKLILPLDKTYGNISGRVLSLDITPGVSKNFADAIIICDEGDTNA